MEKENPLEKGRKAMDERKKKHKNFTIKKKRNIRKEEKEKRSINMISLSKPE